MAEAQNKSIYDAPTGMIIKKELALPVRLPAYREILAYNKVAEVMWAIWHPKKDVVDREPWRDRNNDGDDKDGAPCC